MNNAEWSRSPRSASSTNRSSCAATTWNAGIGEPDRPSRVQDDPRVLAVQPGAEPRLERTVQHPLAVHLQDLRSGEPAEERLTHLRGVHARALREHERLGDGLDRRRHDQLVARLRDLARAARTDVHDVLPHRLQDRHRARERPVGAAHHDGERPVDGPALPAGDRRVEHLDVARGQLLGDRARRPGIDRAHVDHQRPRRRAGQPRRRRRASRARRRACPAAS